jgi:signal transduction histidine kinase
MPPDRLQRVFLYHIWACVPFAVAWAVAPGVFSVSQDPHELVALGVVLGAALAYLLLRSWIVLRRPLGHARWGYVWPVADALLVTAGLVAKTTPTESWLLLLYLIPIAEAAATLSLAWAASVAGVAVAGYLISSGASGLAGLQYTYASFRLFFLLLCASLFTAFGRELARLHRRLAAAEQRNEIAADLHDGLQQYLATIAARLELADTLRQTDPARAAELAADQRHLARQAGDEVRMIVRRMGGASAQWDLAEAIRQYARLFDERTGLDVELRLSDAAAALPEATQRALLRIAQEALSNVAKHARATHACVELQIDAQHVTCSITDDGVGFDPECVDAPAGGLGGAGLGSMRRRALDAGGDLQVTSRPGGGTTVVVEVPLEGV